MEYYACDWIVRADAPYGHFATTALELGCVLMQVKPERVDDNGCIYLHFVINVPDDTILTEFMDRIGTHWGLTSWYLVSEAQYQRGAPFFADPALKINPLLGLVWAQQFNEMGRKNQQQCPDQV